MRAQPAVVLSGVLIMALLLTGVAPFGPVMAQSGGKLDLRRNVIAGGGEKSTGSGNLEVTGTVGQPAAGTLTVGGAITQQGLRFIARYPAMLDGPQFVEALLATVRNDLGVELASQRNSLIDQFNAGGKGAVLYRLVDDNVATNTIYNRPLIDAEYNRAFVFAEYAGYLRRDSDIGGFNFWLGQVNRFPVRNVDIQHAMVCSFLTSAEYQNRFSPVVTHTNAECPQ